MAAVETISRPASAGHDGGRHHPAVRVRKLKHPVEAQQPSSRPDGRAYRRREDFAMEGSSWRRAEDLAAEGRKKKRR